jgi:hypothetical protein
MEPSENLKDIDRLYRLVCNAMKGIAGATVPTKENFALTYQKFHELVNGHKTLLTAIGKL